MKIYLPLKNITMLFRIKKNYPFVPKGVSNFSSRTYDVVGDGSPPKSGKSHLIFLLNERPFRGLSQ
ncbi:MAG: hypothetical protein JG781_2188 [Peptococcaceae bacterium]|jgi:hypothetical protein|nr:hypothetical protein [Peptococcaceae bacterium]